MQQKRLYRSINNRAIAGVAAGMGEYLGIDPTIMRILFVLVAVATAVVPTFIVYIILAAILPQGYTSYGNQPNQQNQPPQQAQQQPYQPGYPQTGSVQSAVDNVVKGVEQVGREIGNALGLNRQPGQPPQQNQQPGYQQPGYQPQPPTSTYQGSNQLENMGTPVSNAPQPQAEPAPLPPAPQPYSGEAQRGYSGNANLGNLGQSGNNNPHNGNTTMNQARSSAMVMRHNPWLPVLAVALAFFFLPALIFAGLHIFGLGAGLVFHGIGFGVNGIGWLIGRLLPIVFIGLLIAAIVNHGRRRRF